MNQQPKQSLIQQQIQYWQASDHVSPKGTGCHPSEAARNQNNKLEKTTAEPNKKHGRGTGRTDKPTTHKSIKASKFQKYSPRSRIPGPRSTIAI
jgi:hypothetical protein